MLILNMSYPVRESFLWVPGSLQNLEIPSPHFSREPATGGTGQFAKSDDTIPIGHHQIPIPYIYHVVI